MPALRSVECRGKVGAGGLSNATVEPALAGGWGAVGARQIAPAKISENCYGTFPFLCYIPALSKGAKAFPVRQ
jgi:hypothetical protein